MGPLSLALKGESIPEGKYGEGNPIVLLAHPMPTTYTHNEAEEEGPCCSPCPFTYGKGRQQAEQEDLPILNVKKIFGMGFGYGSSDGGAYSRLEDRGEDFSAIQLEMQEDVLDTGANYQSGGPPAF